MIAIIDGKKYDTEKSKSLFYWDNKRYAGDFKLRSKELFLTPNGRFFILHSGEPLTDMGVPCCGGMTGSTRIEPVNEDDAFGFLCSHDGAEVAEALFPDKIEEA